MKKKTFVLVSALTTAAATAAAALVTFFNPGYAEAINSSITVVEGSIITICGFFVTE